jgi:hypothetical protein
MEQKNPYFVLVTQDEKLRETIETMAKEFPTVKIKHYNDVTAFFVEKCLAPISGVFLDFRLGMKLSSKEREEFSVIESIAPFYRVRGNPNGQIAAMGGLKSGEGETFFRSIFKESLNAPLRKLRNFYRQTIHLNLMVCFGEHFVLEKSFKANSDNISMGGIFVIHPDDWSKNERIWVLVNDFPEIPPIECKKRWHIEWGKSYKSLPGYGLEFVTLTDTQKDLMNRIIYHPQTLKKT